MSSNKTKHQEGSSGDPDKPSSADAASKPSLEDNAHADHYESEELNLIHSVIQQRLAGPEDLRRQKETRLLADYSSRSTSTASCSQAYRPSTSSISTASATLDASASTYESSSRLSSPPRQGNEENGSEEQEDSMEFMKAVVASRRGASMQESASTALKQSVKQQPPVGMPVSQTGCPTMEPGAYQEAPGTCQRTPEFRHSTIGHAHERDTESQTQQTSIHNGNQIIQIGNMETMRDLVEANPVFCEMGAADSISTATYIDQRLEEAKKMERQKKLIAMLLLVCVLLSMVVAVAVVVVIKVQPKPPTISPTMAPTHSTSPSAAPSSILDELLTNLPFDSVQRIQNSPLSPQGLAYDWLLNHPSISTLPEWRKTQLFALVVFYHSMAGPQWPKIAQDGWLNYDTDECYWFSTIHGYFYGGKWTLHGSNNGGRQDEEEQLCTEDDRIIRIVLETLDLNLQKPFLPTELSLLTSLEGLNLGGNNINNTLAAFIPKEVFQMASLKQLLLWSNALTGEVPSEIGLLSNLEYLEMSYNSLIGALPSTLGQMTSLTRLDLSDNRLTGSLPSQVGSMTSLEMLHLYGNSLSSTLPTEMGQLKELEWVYLYINELSGPLPSQLGSLTDNLVSLRIDDNPRLTGVLPSQFGRLTKLDQLDLTNCDLSGTIPEEVAALVSSELGDVRLEGNDRLQGTIPASLCVLQDPDCSYTVSIFRNQCVLRFDCGSDLCGCNCACSS